MTILNSRSIYYDNVNLIAQPTEIKSGKVDPLVPLFDIVTELINEQGNVLGMMPHPERAMEPLLGSTDGLGLFTSLLKSLAGARA